MTELENPDWDDDRTVTIRENLSSPGGEIERLGLAWALEQGIVEPGNAKGVYKIPIGPGGGGYVGHPSEINAWLAGFGVAVQLERGTYPPWEHGNTDSYDRLRAHLGVGDE